MGSNRARAAVLTLAVAAVVVLFVALSGGGDDEPPTTTVAATPEPSGGGSDREKEGQPKPAKPKVPTIEIKGGRPVGGVQELEFKRGEDIVFRVESDTADHVHFHGYDIFMGVAAGGEVRFDVPASVEGVFEVELEDTATQIAEITVSPG